MIDGPLSVNTRLLVNAVNAIQDLSHTRIMLLYSKTIDGIPSPVIEKGHNFISPCSYLAVVGLTGTSIGAKKVDEGLDIPNYIGIRTTGAVSVLLAIVDRKTDPVPDPDPDLEKQDYN